MNKKEMPNVIKYVHHDVQVSVIEEFKGKNRDISLCYTCSRFNPTDPIFRCPIATMLYEFVVANNLVAPIMECPHYIQGEDNREIGKQDEECDEQVD